MTDMNFSMLTPTEGEDYVVRMLSSPYTRRQRLMALGIPGSGKTFMFGAAAKRMGAKLIALHLLQLDIGAFRGLERIAETEDGLVTTPVRPHFLPEYVAPEDITDDTPRYLILLDEFMAVDGLMRKSAFELLTEHRCGPHLLGDNVYVCAAGNTAEDGTNVVPLDRAEKRRMTFFGVTTTAAGVIEHGARTGWHHHILSFIKNNDQMLVPSDEDFTNENLATPNPASYEKCSDTLKALDAGHITLRDAEVSIMGNIGDTAASEMLLQIRDEEARFDLHALIDAAPADRVYPKNVFGVHSLGNALHNWADDGEKLDKAVDIMIGMPDGSAAHPHEAKVAFILLIGDKITKFRRFPKYIDNPVVLQLLDETQSMTDLADAEHEAMLRDEAAQAALDAVEARQAA